MDNLWSFWSALGYCVFIQTFKRSWVRWCSCGLCLFSWSLCLWFGHSPLRVLFACLRLHWLHMSPATQVESKPDGILTKERQKTFPRGFAPWGGAVHRRRVWSKGFSHSAGNLAREMSHPALIALSSFYLPQSSQKSTHQHRGELGRRIMYMLSEVTGLDMVLLLHGLCWPINHHSVDLSKFGGNSHVRQSLVIRNTTNAEADPWANLLCNSWCYTKGSKRVFL